MGGAGQRGDPMAFFAELKRRRVGKVAIAYGAIAWGVTEATSVVLPALRRAGLVGDLRRRLPAGRLPGGDGAGLDLRRRARRHRAHRAAGGGAEVHPHAPADRLRGRGAAAHGGPRLPAVRARLRPRPRRPGAQLGGRPAVHQPERRRGARLLQRRHVRGTPQPAGARARAPGRLAHLLVRLQGPQRGHPRSGPRARRRDRARGQRAPVGRPGAHHRPADRRRDRLPPLVRDLRPAARGHLPGAGRDRRRRS